MSHEPSFSLIYPENYRPNADDTVLSESPELIKRLGADWLFHHRLCNMGEYLTRDPAVIRYRRDALRDVLEHPAMENLVRGAAERLEQIDELLKMRDTSNMTTEAQFFSIRELETYLELVEFMETCFARLEADGGTLISHGFRCLRESIREKIPECTELRRGYNKMEMSVRSIRSVTLGFNLDTTMSPYEAGLLSINTQPIRSGELIDRLLNMDLSRDEFTALVPMTAVSRRLTPREKASVDMVFMSAMKKVYGGALRQWAPMIRRYLASGSCIWVRLLPEFRFLQAAVDILNQLKQHALPLVFPDIHPREEACFEVTGLYNPALALHLADGRTDGPVRMVSNQLTFDEQGGIYILTGPNSGGKSVFTCAVGIAQVMFQLGLPVAATKAAMSPVDGIFTHFAQDTGTSSRDGRLGNECDGMRQIFSRLTRHSLVLLDETFSGTSSFEGSYLAADLLRTLSAFGVHAIFCTHMHELTAHIPEINADPAARAHVDTLVAGSGESDTSERFRILRRPPDGQSYAARIAAKYGLSYAELVKMRKE